MIGCFAGSNENAGILVSGLSGLEAQDSTLLLLSGMESNKQLVLGNGLEALYTNGLQLIGCYFEWNRPGGPAEQFILADHARGLVIDGSWFGGKGGLPGVLPVLRVAKLTQCEAVTFVSNSGFDWVNEMVLFENAGGPLTEFGDRAAPLGQSSAVPIPPTYVVQNAPVLGLSQGALQVFGYPTPLPVVTPVLGALRWIDQSEAMQVFDGQDWKSLVIV